MSAELDRWTWVPLALLGGSVVAAATLLVLAVGPRWAPGVVLLVGIGGWIAARQVLHIKRGDGDATPSE